MRWGWLVVVFWVSLCGAQAVPADAGAVLQQMASHAGAIFSGQVVAVTRDDAAGFVDVRFHIEQALRGCPRSGSYTLREWAGLWTGHPDRYRVGQRRLMLLTARGPGGMSAPVGGLDGAIPLVGKAAEPLADANGVAPPDTGAAADAVVDLRWIQARVPRGIGSVTARAEIVAVGRPVLPTQWSGAVSPIVTPAQAPSVSAVFAALGAAKAAVAGGVADARY